MNKKSQATNQARSGKPAANGQGPRDGATKSRAEKGNAENGNMEAATGNRWTFLTNHAHVLCVLNAQPQMVLREVALQVGITERAVQRIVQDLEEAGFITRQKVGRQNTYEVLTELPLRHPIEAHRTIGDLLKLVAPDEL
ncbi:MAG: helix-turn-helix transcriptional regulator [Aureliella sp.]